MILYVLDCFDPFHKKENLLDPIWIMGLCLNKGKIEKVYKNPAGVFFRRSSPQLECLQAVLFFCLWSLLWWQLAFARTSIQSNYIIAYTKNSRQKEKKSSHSIENNQNDICRISLNAWWCLRTVHRGKRYVVRVGKNP